MEPYNLIDEAALEICALEAEWKELSDWAALFEVAFAEMTALHSCRREVKMIKVLWDYAMLVHSCIQLWKMTFWKQVDFEKLEIECKQFSKHLRSLDKDMRSWDTYVGLDATIRDLVTSLKVRLFNYLNCNIDNIVK